MHYYRKVWVVVLGLALGLAILLSSTVGAQSQVGLIQGDPLKIQLNSDGSLQVWHKNYTSGASFGSAGSGFFIVADKVTYGPFFGTMDFVDQTATTGRGTRSDPFRSVLHMRVNSGDTHLDVTQTVLYVNGSPSFQLEWRIVNTGTANICLKTYHAADLYFANDDYGIGYYNAATGSVGGYNQAKDWFMVFTPVNAATHHEEAYYGTIWSKVQNQQDLSDTIDSSYIDNGAALQWDFCLAAGQSKTVTDVWSFGVSEGAIVAAAQEAAGGGDSFGGGVAGPLGLSAPRFRAVSPGAPDITTSIPTPLDIKLTPAVVGSNLLWAAIASIFFIIASEILNRTLIVYEAFFKRLFKPFGFIGKLYKKLGLTERLGRPAWFEWVKLAIITIIYGIIFSAMDRNWKPFTFNGVWLFFTMAIAFGVVGLIDDIVQWNTARRWKLPTRISINPGNLIIALFSTLLSRTLVLTPGVLFGTPEAFEIDPNVLTKRHKNRLLLLAAGVLLGILLASWLPTVLTNLALTSATTLPDKIRSIIQVPVNSLQTLLLLVFAVTIQNIFLHMLALPDTIGEMIRRWNRVVWFILLMLVSFLLLQTLLNPNGDLARTIQTSNIRVFIGTIIIFLIFTVAMRLLLNRFRPQDATGFTPAPDALAPSPMPGITVGDRSGTLASPVNTFSQPPAAAGTSATQMSMPPATVIPPSPPPPPLEGALSGTELNRVPSAAPLPPQPVVEDEAPNTPQGVEPSLPPPAAEGVHSAVQNAEPSSASLEAPASPPEDDAANAQATVVSAGPPPPPPPVV